MLFVKTYPGHLIIAKIQLCQWADELYIELEQCYLSLRIILLEHLPFYILYFHFPCLIEHYLSTRDYNDYQNSAEILYRLQKSVFSTLIRPQNGMSTYFQLCLF